MTPVTNAFQSPRTDAHTHTLIVDVTKKSKIKIRDPKHFFGAEL